MLYPIPLESGMTTAIPKGNTLICSFLTENENDYIGRLGVIVHEMCHILFDEQPLHLQNKIDRWFKESESDYSKLAYSYLDEGLATAIGNGWAYQQIHGEVDTMQWYNDEYIDGFGHALFSEVSNYLAEGKMIDKTFIENAIALFGKTFPNANADVNTLLKVLQVYSNVEEREKIDELFGTLQSNFDIHSAWLSTPIDDDKSKETFQKDQITKLFIIENNNASTIDLLKKEYEEMPSEIPTTENFILAFKTKKSRSTVFIVNLIKLKNLEKTLKVLKNLEAEQFGEVVQVKA
jgi:hypothetical protein